MRNLWRFVVDWYKSLGEDDQVSVVCLSTFIVTFIFYLFTVSEEYIILHILVSFLLGGITTIILVMSFFLLLGAKELVKYFRDTTLPKIKRIISGDLTYEEYKNGK